MSKIKRVDMSSEITIKEDEASNRAIVNLLNEHERDMATTAPAESRHALNHDELGQGDIKFWSAWRGDDLVACAGLVMLNPGHGEVKSMRTAKSFLRTGAGSALLAYIVALAQAEGMKQLSLETGSMDYFAPARALYRKHGFKDGPPFAEYELDENSCFMHLFF